MEIDRFFMNACGDVSLGFLGEASRRFAPRPEQGNAAFILGIVTYNVIAGRMRRCKLRLLRSGDSERGIEGCGKRISQLVAERLQFSRHEQGLGDTPHGE